MILLTLHLVMCIYLTGSVVHRAVAMSHYTRADVRAVFWALGVVATAGAVIPLLWPWRPDPYALCLTGTICAIQFVTARHWRAGVPDCFQRPGCIPRNRRASDAPTILNLDRQP